MDKNHVYYQYEANYQEDNQEIEKEIQLAKELFEEQKKTVAKAEEICNILEKNYVSKIRAYKTTWDLKLESLSRAHMQQKLEDNKNRSAYNYIKHEIEREFFGDHVLDAIEIHKDYYDCCYYIRTKYNDTHVEIVIPIRQSITSKTYMHSYSGKFALLVESSPSCWNLLVSSYMEKDIADFISKYDWQKSMD